MIVENDIGWEAAKKGEWNRYEVLAVGDCIWLAVNGELCTAIKDPEGERSGVIALQIHAGKPQTTRYRIVRLVHDPQMKMERLTEKQLREALEDPVKNGNRARKNDLERPKRTTPLNSQGDVSWPVRVTPTIVTVRTQNPLLSTVF